VSSRELVRHWWIYLACCGCVSVTKFELELELLRDSFFAAPAFCSPRWGA
jgi:hypothetical protein